jgi:hypothetical protein
MRVINKSNQIKSNQIREIGEEEKEKAQDK